jgi:CHAT domain-containing protein
MADVGAGREELIQTVLELMEKGGLEEAAGVLAANLPDDRADPVDLLTENVASRIEKGWPPHDAAGVAPLSFADLASRPGRRADPVDLALSQVRDLLRLHAAQRPGSTDQFVREQAFEETRGAQEVTARSFSSAQVAEYFHTYDAIVFAAASGSRPNFARRLLRSNLGLRRWADEQGYTNGLWFSSTVSLGRIALRAAAYTDAYFAYERIRRLLLDAGKTDDYLLESRIGIGRVWLGLGDVQRGEELIWSVVESIPVADRQFPWVDALLELYDAKLDRFDRSGAVRCHQALLAGGDKGSSDLEIEARMAETSRPEQAIAMYEQLTKEGQSVRRSALMRVWRRLLGLYVRSGRVTAAYELLNETYPICEFAKGRDHPWMSQLDETAAQVLAASGHPEWAINCLNNAAVRDSLVLPLQVGVSSTAQRARLLDAMRRRVEFAVALAAEEFPHNMAMTGGLFALINRFKFLGASMQQTQWRELAKRAPEDRGAQELSRRIAELRSEITRRAVFTQEGEPPLARLVSQREESEIEAAYHLHGIDFADEIQISNPQSISMCLPEDSSYIEYLRCRSPRANAGDADPDIRWVAFVVNARFMMWNMIDLGTGTEIDDLAVRYRALLAQGPAESRDAKTPDSSASVGIRRTEELREIGLRLRQLVLDPVLALVEGRRRLVVGIDDVLGCLPFDCLPQDAGEHMIDDYCISYVFTCRAVTLMNSGWLHDDSPASTAAATAPLLVGAVEYGSEIKPAATAGGGAAAAFRFGSLAGTKVEVDVIGQLLGVSPVTGSDASTTRIRDVRSPLIIHLATHGFAIDSPKGAALAAQPLLRTGVALCGANAGADGLLSAEEVLSLDLRGTALAVLSACETGLGRAERGEGLATLGRSFEVAGASAVVAGVWKVPDAETAQLMAAFYGHIANMTPCAEAMRAAKLQVRADHPDPYYWGGFSVFGQCGSIAVGNWDGSKGPVGA